MSKINGIYAAAVSILDKNLSLDINKTIKHAENLIDQGCHGVVMLGSTGQAQLISFNEKINLIKQSSKSRYKENFIFGTGFNSLNDTITFMSAAKSFNFDKFLIMPPAYYFYGDKDAINFFSKIVEKVPSSKVILYNFEKLCGYKFSVECVSDLAKKYPNQIVGVKDSSYNLYDKINLENFSILPGSELKLLKGLKLGCSGIISATCNVTANLARKVYDDFKNKKNQNFDEKMRNVRDVFDNFNLISGVHTFLSESNSSYKNLLPPLGLLNTHDKQKLFKDLNKLKFKSDFLKVA